MTTIQYFILSIIHGITEFLPVSSSAHFILVPYFLNWTLTSEQLISTKVVLELGSLFAVIIYFWQELVTIIKAFFHGLASKEPFNEFESRLGWYILLATIPAALIGMTLSKLINSIFSKPMIVALMLFVSAGFLILADLYGKRSRNLSEISWWDALWIGLFQALSIVPGISRTGSTLAGGMTHHLDRTSSARFSFLLAIPVMLGTIIANINSLFHLTDISSAISGLLLAFFTTAIIGYLSLHWFLNFIKRRKLYGFSIYCASLACITLLVGALRSDATASSIISPSSTKSATSSVNATSTALQPNGFRIIDISYTPSVEWIVPTMSSCADVIGNSGLLTHEIPTSSLNTTSSDLTFRWGPPEPLAVPAYQIGEEELIVVVNKANPLQELPAKIARNLFSGDYATWGELRTACPDCFRKNADKSLDSSAISLGFYPRDEDIQMIFISAVMNGRPAATGAALLIPDPHAMVEFLQGDKTAIGFLPAHATDPSLRKITITDINADKLTQPILVISSIPPTGAERELLLCMQNLINPK